MNAVNQHQASVREAPRPTKLFRNGNSQAVRIPKALAFESIEVEVEIERRGDELIVRPAKRKLTGLGAAFRKLQPFFEDFQREQPVQGERRWLAGSAHPGTSSDLRK